MSGLRAKKHLGATEGTSRMVPRSGGESYAARAACVVGVGDVVKGCCPKRHPPEGVAVDYAVDDDEGVVEEFGGQLVSACRGDPEDTELLRVVEALSRGSGR